MQEIPGNRREVPGSCVGLKIKVFVPGENHTLKLSGKSIEDIAGSAFKRGFGLEAYKYVTGYGPPFYIFELNCTRADKLTTLSHLTNLFLEEVREWGHWVPPDPTD